MNPCVPGSTEVKYPLKGFLNLVFDGKLNEYKK
jgi:hypothetical protein